jgi:hypothetical protein
MSDDARCPEYEAPSGNTNVADTRLRYEAPRLDVLGTLRELTQGGGSPSSFDAMGSVSGSGGI